MPTQTHKLQINFIIKLGLALHRCGATSYRIENHLLNLAKFWNIEASFLVTPTAFTFIFSSNPDDQRTHIARVQPSENDLGKLAVIDEIVEKVVDSQVTLDEAIELLIEAKQQPGFYGVKTEALGWCVTGGAFAMLLSSSSLDIISSFLFSFLVFILYKLSAHSLRLASVVEFFAPFISAILACFVASLGIHINVPFVILSSVIIFIPGLALTVALSEIVNKDLVSGTSKLVDATMLLFKLYFGALLGITLGNLIWTIDPLMLDMSYSLPDWKNYIAVVALSTGLVVAFNVHKSDMIWGIAAGLIAYIVSTFAAQYLGFTLGTFVGSFTVGLFSNIYAIVKNRPASIVLLQGIVLLVPGSRTYMDLNTYISGHQILNNINDSGFVFMIFIAILAGMILANAVLPAKKSL
ncbi:threonine/serine exporter family protein [Moritella sp.]|uniref:threonine/serine ThrE exporter family protein n=1 Tax=Moritella sp. TaxID=78556 RepID=UPI001D2BBBC1|nr:threonine/serine exporter family protein [Moritella sp.]MCJ8349950.1 threonine/serine exporter family protein [Moritella sp.]NQZ39757.1 threonine/serine exporter family protein [Moritella sp.]